MNRVFNLMIGRSYAYPILDTRISVRSSFVTLTGPPLKSEIWLDWRALVKMRTLMLEN